MEYMKDALLLSLVSLMSTSHGCADKALPPSQLVSDVFTQHVVTAVDILLVVDNSSSMSQEQEALGASFNNFITKLRSSSIDYQVGVITTDPADNGILRTGAANQALFIAHNVDWPFDGPAGQQPFITTQTTDMQAVFAELVTVGTWGAAQQQGLETATMALGIGPDWDGISAPNIPVANNGVFRPDATLFIIHVSNEDDKSYGPVRYYHRAIESYKGHGNHGRVSVSCIAGLAPDSTDEHDDSGCQYAVQSNASWGARYIELSSLTDGVATSIFEDFNKSLTTLSYAAAGLGRKFGPLSRPHDPFAKIDCKEAYNNRPCCVQVNKEPVPMLPFDSQRSLPPSSQETSITTAMGRMPLK